MKKITLDCPKCGASLEIDEGIDTFFCTYCGVKVVTGDKDRINAQLKVKEMEFKERNDQRNAKKDIIEFAFIVILILSILIIAFLASIQDNKKEENNQGRIQILSSSDDFEGENYIDIKNKLEDKGFENIECVEMQEKSGIFKKAGDIDRVVIDGRTDYKYDDYFDADVKIKIYYYTK